MQTCLEPHEFHKKGLSFSSPRAVDLVSRDNLLACKTRYFAFCENGDGDFEIRYFKSAPQQRALTCLREEVVSDPSLSLKGLMVVDRNLVIKHTNGILSLCTKERTWLLAAKTEDSDLEKWVKVLQSKLSTFQRRSILATAAISARNSLTIDIPMATRVTVAVDQKTKFQDIWTDATKRAKFREFLRFSFAEENFLFYEAVERHFDLVESTGAEKQLDSARQLCNVYVKDSGEKQVNLSSGQRHALLNAVGSVPGAISQVNSILLDCQREIYDLMNRNFFFRFQAQFEAELHRQALLAETNGCFSTLFERRGGVAAFTALAKQFESMQFELDQIVKLVGLRIELNRTYLTNMQSKTILQLKQRESTSTGAIGSVLELCHQENVILEDYVKELVDSVHDPLLVLQRNVDTGYSGLRNLISPAVESIQQSEARCRALAAEQAHARQQLDELNTAMLQQLTSSELAAQQAKFSKLQQHVNQLEASLSDAEVLLVSTESSVQTDFVRAFDQLESLALYRLDTLRDLLQRLVLTEQNPGTRLGLKLGKTLDLCCNIDAIGDLMVLVDAAEQ